MAVKCVDVSAYQSEINWEKVKKDGYTAVIIRAGYGKGNADKMFKKHIEGAIKAGLSIGIYWFSYAYTKAMGKNEGLFCAKIIAPYRDKITMPVFFDFEGDSLRYMKQNKVSPTKRLITDITKAFCDAVKEAGYTPGFYYNYDYKKNHYFMDELKSYAHWYALYDTSDKQTDCFAQQYSSHGKVSGISGNVDVNWIFGVIPKVQAETPASTVTVAKSFKKGDKGKGVVEVQKLVNKANEGTIRPKLKEDGDFGEKTDKEVRFMQSVRHITVDGIFGPASRKQAEKKVTAAMKAINWAVSVSMDNSYTYGVGQRAHRGGCPFCGTNTGPKMKKKEKSGEPHFVGADGKKWKSGKKYTYEKTYCCNPFIFSAYAHGAGDAKMLAKCKAGGNATTGMEPDAWAKWGFEIIGKCSKVDFKDLKPGDVVMFRSNTGGHVWMYTGGDYMVEASGGSFSENSIRHKSGAKKRFNTYKGFSKAYVVRYKK